MFNTAHVLLKEVHGWSDKDFEEKIENWNKLMEKWPKKNVQFPKSTGKQKIRVK